MREGRNSREAEGRPKRALDRWKRDKDAQMNRQTSVESEYMLRTGSSSRSVDKERTIIVFHSSTLRRDCIFVGESFNFEPRRINNDMNQLSKKGTERIYTQLTTNQRNSTRTGQLDNEESRFRGTRTMPYTPVSCGTGHSFRGIRTIPYTH